MGNDDKIIRSIYVSKRLWEKAKAEGINLSELVNNVLSELLDDSSELELMKIEEEIKQLRQQLITLEMKRQQLLKRLAERQKEKNREAELYKMMTEFLKLKEAELKANSNEEISRISKERNKLFNEILKVAGLQKGTNEFFTFSKLLNAGKLDEALGLAKALWKK